MPDAPEDSQILKTVVERQLVTPHEVRTAVDYHKKILAGGRRRPMSEVLVDLGFLTRTQLNRLQGVNDDSGGQPAQQILGTNC